MKLKKLSVALVIFLSMGNCYALDVPVGSAYDSRIKTVMYNPEDVTQIDSVIGVATHIILDPGESYITHSFGDSDAWQFGHAQNHYFVKPKAENGDTNLTIVTDKRTYNFDIRYHFVEYTKANKGRTNFDKAMTFQVQFKYPEIEAAKKKKIDDDKKRQQVFSQLLAKGVNTKYTFNGEKALTPVNVWDSQGFTYFKFAVGQDIPNIYSVDFNGDEHNENRHMEGQYKEIVVMHKVSKEWRIRLGKAVTGVYNENDGSVPEIRTSNGTVSDEYKRVIINE
ncbi:hypothetical protein FZI27_20130 [Cronobacter sakazakii]|nr:hypothetical protein FZI27_20130 [Cronobacter sakazakii]